MEKNKIQILNLNFFDNYGAVLVAYSLSTVLNYLDADVQLINFTPPELYYKDKLYYNPFRIVSVKVNYKFLKSTIYKFLNHPVQRFIRMIKFSIFRQSFLLYGSRKIYSSVNLRKYIYGQSKVLIGSDQVWNTDVVGLYIKDFLFSYSQANTKISSYAASITKRQDEFEERVFKSAFEKMDRVSIRESYHQKSFNSRFKLNLKTHIDPTFLLSKSHYKMLSKKISLPDEFILIYDMRINEPFIDLVKFLNNKLNLDIITFSNENHYGFKNKSFFTYSPREFLYLYSKAKYIVSSSYHGLIFSIIFNKSFVAFNPKNKSIRMTDLLNKLDIKNKFFDMNSTLKHDIIFNSLVESIDYKKVNNKIDSLKKDAINYLSSFIKGE